MFNFFLLFTSILSKNLETVLDVNIPGVYILYSTFYISQLVGMDDIFLWCSVLSYMFQISKIHFSVFLEIQHILAPDSFFIYYDSKGGIIWHFFNKHGQILLARVLNDKKVKKWFILFLSNTIIASHFCKNYFTIFFKICLFGYQKNW